jgi:hypothetical protein
MLTPGPPTERAAMSVDVVRAKSVTARSLLADMPGI